MEASMEIECLSEGYIGTRALYVNNYSSNGIYMFRVWAGQRLLPVTYILENYSKAPPKFHYDKHIERIPSRNQTNEVHVSTVSPNPDCVLPSESSLSADYVQKAGCDN